MEKTVLLHLLLQCTSLLLVQAASSELTEGDNYQTTFDGRGGGLIYSSNDSTTPYFGDTLSFDAIDGKIVLGAADKLYIFNKDLTLDEGGVYSWPTTAGSCPSNGDDYVCRNHIRIYQRPSEGSSSLFVCGTQSGVQPQCRILNITGSSLVETGQPSPTNLVSAHPDLPGFGEFRRGDPLDDVYFTANFRTTNPTSSSSYDISYQQVNISEDGAMVETERLYGWNQTSNFWLNSPVVFVDYRRVDAGPSALHEFYFVFLRERVGEEIQSRVVRQCRNDDGVVFNNTRTNPPTSAKIFNSFLKARVVCEREPPPGTRFVGAQDFNYNEMWSTAFNSPDGGRYHETTPYVHMMYGAFSGPRIGPIGSAVCVYRASFTSGGLKRGLFDPFREDVRSSIDGTPIENMYITCESDGRPAEYSQYVQAEHNVEQLVENPLLVADGFYITQMVVDQVCVVKRDDASVCVNQDVLFLGTSDGRVLKVVFATDTGGGGNILPIFPVLAEEITLGDGSSVKEMQIDVDTKELYVVTSTKVYRMPVEQCSRHGNDFVSCIRSRDPYCAWNAALSRCAYSNLTATGDQSGSVPIYIRQNIHTGNVTLPIVHFDMESYTTEEGAEFSVTLTSDRVVGDGVVEVYINDLTAQVGVNVNSVNPIPISFQQSSSNPMLYEARFTIRTIRDDVYKGDIQFQLSLRNTIAGAVYFPQQNATVTITDIDGTPFRVGFVNLESTCRVWTRVYTDATKLLSTEIAKALNLAETNIISVTLNCSTNNDDNYVTLVGVLLVTSDRSIDDLLMQLQKWITGSPTLKIESFNIDVDKECTARIPPANDTLCVPTKVGGVSPQTAAAVSASTVTGLSVGFVIVSVLVAVLAVAVILLVVLLWRAKKPHVGCESPEVSPQVKGTRLSQLNGHEDSNRLSLAERRGSMDLHLNTEPAEPLPFTRDTLPKSSEPLLGQRFFSDSGEDHDQPDGPEELANGVHSQTEILQNVSYGSVSPEPSFGQSEQVHVV